MIKKTVNLYCKGSQENDFQTKNNVFKKTTLQGRLLNLNWLKLNILKTYKILGISVFLGNKST